MDAFPDSTTSDDRSMHSSKSFVESCGVHQHRTGRHSYSFLQLVALLDGLEAVVAVECSLSTQVDTTQPHTHTIDVHC